MQSRSRPKLGQGNAKDLVDFKTALRLIDINLEEPNPLQKPWIIKNRGLSSIDMKSNASSIGTTASTKHSVIFANDANDSKSRRAETNLQMKLINAHGSTGPAAMRNAFDDCSQNGDYES